MMKTMLSEWVDRVAELAVGEGSLWAFTPRRPRLSFKTLPARAASLVCERATHRIEDTVASATARAASNGTRPVLVAYLRQPS